MHWGNCFDITSRFRTLDIDNENTMRTSWLIVFGCFAYNTIGISYEEIIESILLSIAMKTL
jgi:hypothetical protein